MASDIMCWAHSTEAPATELLMGASAASATSSMNMAGFDLRKCGVCVPLQQASVRLPAFLAALHRPLLMAGLQLRYLMQMPQCSSTVVALERSGAQQVRVQRNIARAEVAGLVDNASSSLFDTGNATGASTVVAAKWACGISWSLQASMAAQQAGTDAARERAAAASSMLSNLRAARQAAASREASARLAALQALKAAALEREQEAQQAAEEQHRHKLQALRAAAAAAAHQDEAKQVPCHLPLAVFAVVQLMSLCCAVHAWTMGVSVGSNIRFCISASCVIHMKDIRPQPSFPSMH